MARQLKGRVQSGKGDILLVPCILNLAMQPAWLWTPTTAARERVDPWVVEIIAATNLRSTFGLVDGSIVEVQLLGESDDLAPPRSGGDMAEPLGLESKTVRVVAYDARWPELFRTEAARLANAISAAEVPALTFEHIGSTAVPGLAAKPILDVAAGRPMESSAADYVPVLEAAGYIYRGESGLPGREFFRRGDLRSHHLHLVAFGGSHWRRYLGFRDALRADNSLRDAYAALKHELAARYPYDREAYIDGKTSFVENVVRTLGLRRDDGA